MVDGAPVTAQDLRDWHSPAHVLERALRTISEEREAKAAVWMRVKSGLIKAYSLRSSTHRGRYTAPQPKLEPVPITTDLWVKYDDRPHKFWRGEAEFIVNTASSYRTDSAIYIHCFDIKLDPADVEREFPDIKPKDEPQPEGVIPVGAKGGGRPRAWWREPLLIELAGQLHDLTLEPKNLADLERAAHEWLAQHDEYGKETTVRTVVTPLWQRISKGVKNPKG